MTVAASPARADWVEEVVPLTGGEVCLLRPRDFEDLLCEEAFEQEELLPYWAHLWGSSVALAEVLASRALRGARVLELGCGLGLPSIAAARAGGRVTASDWSPPALAATAANAERNDVEVTTLECAWEDPGPLLEGAPWDLVLGSDVLYERRCADVLGGLVPRLMRARGEAWIADPGRAAAESFVQAVDGTCERRSSPSAHHPQVTVHRLRPAAAG
jgi:predicted nicotinamide N-methyase